jgi:hypothetical protein
VIRLGLDFETFYDQHLTLRVMSTEAYIAHPRFAVNGCAVIGPGVREFMDEPRFRAFCAKVPWDRVEVVAHNAGFDGRVLARKYGVRPARWIDTMAMAKALIWHHTFAVSLDACADFFGLPGKSGVIGRVKGMYAHQVRAAGLWPQYAAYALQDDENALELARIMEPMMPPGEMEMIDWTVRQVTEPVLRVDRALLAGHLAEVQAEKDAKLVRTGLGDRAALMSADKFAELLRGYGEEPERKRTTKGEVYAFAKTDPYMEGLLEHDDPDLQALAAARLGFKSTMEETRTARFIEVADACAGLMPVPLAYHAAHTGRWGGTDKMNVQNLTHGSPLRTCLLAPPGCKLLIADQAQIECRLTAYLAGQRDLLDAFAAGRDVYSELASSIFARPVDKARNPDERQAGKIAELSLGYGCGAARFAAMLRAKKAKWHDLPFAERTVKTYRDRRHRVPHLWKNLDAHLSSTLSGGRDSSTFSRLLATTPGYLAGPGRITLPSERSLAYPELGCDALGEGYSYRRYKHGRTTIWGGKLTENIVQATARDLLTDNHRELMRWARIVLQVHDELVAVVLEEEAADAKAEFERVMSRRPWWAPDLPLSVEVKISDRYDK